jgi:putative flippase GtrA
MFDMSGSWRARLRDLIPYALKFGVIGLVCYGIDVGVFNLLRAGALGEDHFLTGPIGAKIVSAAVSTIAAWIANRFWTFRERRRTDVGVEFAEFAVVALVGMGIGVACLAISHYLLGFRSILADNVSGNIIGLVLATAFRFLAYRYWVFGSGRRGSRLATERGAQREHDGGHGGDEDHREHHMSADQQGR